MRKYILPLILVCSTAGAQSYFKGFNLFEVPTTIATSGGTTTLTCASKKIEEFTGSSNQTIVLPSATASGCNDGLAFYITDRSTGTLTIQYHDTTTALTLLAGNQAYFSLVSNGTSNGSWDIGGTQYPLIIGNLTDAGTDGITVTNGAGSVIGTGTSFAQHVADTTHNGYLASGDWNTFNGKQAALTFTAPLVNTTNTITCNAASGSQPGCLSSADWTTFNGKQAAGSYITALTGDVTASGPGAAATTLASVATAGTTGSSTAIPVVTINVKGLTTGITTAAVVAPAGTLSGTTLNSTVVNSSLTSVGTIGTGVWNGTTIAIANGGTNAVSAANGTMPNATSTTASAWTATPTLGVASTTSGTLKLMSSSTANGITIANQGATSAYTFNLPTTAGTSGYTLTTDGSGNLSWTSTLTNPMTTAGDIIYGGASGVPTRLANGSSGQYLTSSGGTSAETWTTPPGAYYIQVYYPGSSSNYWSNANTSFGDFTAVGTIPTPTVIGSNSGFSTISKATSSLPGINFSAPRTGTIEITVFAGIYPGQNSALTTWAMELVESTTSTVLDYRNGAISTNSVVLINYPVTMTAFFNATASATYNFKLESAVSSGTFYIGGANTAGAQLTFSMHYIN